MANAMLAMGVDGVVYLVITISIMLVSAVVYWVMQKCLDVHRSHVPAQIKERVKFEDTEQYRQMKKEGRKHYTNDEWRQIICSVRKTKGKL
jgi:hypothetical protein